jgi:glycosyltransferase involved in cell wall biosynthesis
MFVLAGMTPIIGTVPSPGEIRRILFVTPFDEPVSGADESLLLLIENLDRTRFEPQVLLPKGSHYAVRYGRAGAKVHAQSLSRMRRSFDPLFWGGTAAALRNDLRRLPGWLRSERIDLVHLNMHVALGPLLAARRAGIPTVVHYRAKTNDAPGPFFDRFLPWLHRRADAVVCISEATAAHFLKRGLTRGVNVLPNPVDLRRFAGGSAGGRTVLFVGRIHPQKRIHVLLEALRILAAGRADLSARIVGSAAAEDEAYAARMRSLAAAVGLPVTWVPHVDDVGPQMRSAGVLVLPSVNEGFGRVVVEAMACGIPVVAAASGALPELLRGGELGQLVPPDRSDLLAGAIAAAVDDPRWRRVAEAARAAATENYSIERHVGRLTEIYERLLG